MRRTRIAGLPDPFRPNEEINAIEKGRHYGWP